MFSSTPTSVLCTRDALGVVAAPRAAAVVRAAGRAVAANAVRAAVTTQGMWQGHGNSAAVLDRTADALAFRAAQKRYEIQVPRPAPPA